MQADRPADGAPSPHEVAEIEARHEMSAALVRERLYADLDPKAVSMLSAQRADIARLLASDTALRSSLRAVERERDQAQEALQPFAHFARMWAQKPLYARAVDEHAVYAIHGGTEWEAFLLLGDFRRAAALSPGAATTESEGTHG